MKHGIPKWLISQNKTIYYHYNPFAADDDYGLMLRDCLWSENSMDHSVRLLFDVRNSSVWYTDKHGNPTTRATLDDAQVVIGGSIAIKRSPLLKQDGFTMYSILGKSAVNNPYEYENEAINGESFIEYSLVGGNF